MATSHMATKAAPAGKKKSAAQAPHRNGRAVHRKPAKFVDPTMPTPPRTIYIPAPGLVPKWKKEFAGEWVFAYQDKVVAHNVDFYIAYAQLKAHFRGRRIPMDRVMQFQFYE
jgi:hypothetical protein